MKYSQEDLESALGAWHTYLGNKVAQIVADDDYSLIAEMYFSQAMCILYRRDIPRRMLAIYERAYKEAVDIRDGIDSTE